MMENEGVGQLAPHGRITAPRRRASLMVYNTQMWVLEGFPFVLVPIFSCCLRITSISRRHTARMAGRDLHSEDCYNRKIVGSKSGTV